MRNITLRRNYLLYLIIIAFFAVFYLYSKHSIGNDSSISEWLINYNGGFTRRGMGGEITIFFSDLFNISLRKSILLVQIFLQYFQNQAFCISLYDSIKTLVSIPIAIIP